MRFRVTYRLGTGAEARTIIDTVTAPGRRQAVSKARRDHHADIPFTCLGVQPMTPPRRQGAAARRRAVFLGAFA